MMILTTITMIMIAITGTPIPTAIPGQEGKQNAGERCHVYTNKLTRGEIFLSIRKELRDERNSR